MHNIQRDASLTPSGIVISTFGSKMKKRTTIGLIVLATITAPWWIMASYMGICSLRGRIDEYVYRPTNEFDSAKWQEPNRMYRYAVLGHVTTNIITPGMSQAEVGRLLGQPDFIDTNNVWQYESRIPGWRLIDFSGGGLAVQFSNDNIVTGTVINTWID